MLPPLDDGRPGDDRVEVAPCSGRMEVAPCSGRMEVAPCSGRIEAAPCSGRVEVTAVYRAGPTLELERSPVRPWHRTSAGVLVVLVVTGCAARPDPVAHAAETCELVADGADGDGDRRTGEPLRELLEERFAELAERDRRAYLDAVAGCEDDLAAALDAPARGRGDGWTLELGACRTNPDRFTVDGILGNPTDVTRSYRIVLQYEVGERPLGRGATEVRDVAPGQDATWEIGGALSGPPDPDGRCQLLDVEVSPELE